jgi:signal transduction histidine kinase
MRFRLIGFLMLLCLMARAQSPTVVASTWQKVNKDKTGTISVYWNNSKPFVYRGVDNQIVGIEVDLMKGFQEYLSSQHGIAVDIQWVEVPSFNAVYDTIKTNSEIGVFGLAAFSILEKRKKDIGFSPAYLKDVSVIVSNKQVASTSRDSDILTIFNNLQAISLPNSTYDTDLNELRSKYNLSFDKRYVAGVNDVAQQLALSVNAFGYLDLPNYLTALNEGLNIKRHHFAQVVREGYAITYPLKSDWNEPIDRYFNSVSFKYRRDHIITKYLGMDVFRLIEQIGSEFSTSSISEIRLLTKEKEIQERELNKAALEQQQQESLKNMLILGLFFIATVAGMLYYILRQKTRRNIVLGRQQQKIQEQQEAIADQNISLENSNRELKSLNEQKNDLIGILSHDLRAPINQIKGFAEIYKMENTDMSSVQTDLMDRIINTSNRLTAMIRKIMDVEAVESNKDSSNIEIIHLPKLLREIATSFKSLADVKKINITVEIAADDIYIAADITFVTLVFENLVSNAIKFSEPNKTVKILLLLSEAKANTMIIDQGPGLTKDDKEKLFKKYQKLSAKPTDGEQSTGLGLSIVKQYVETMNGKVWAESNADEGSTFIVQFDQVDRPEQ